MRTFPYLLTLVAIAMSSACRKEIVGTEPAQPDTSAVLVNSSFEVGGNPSLSGWISSSPTLIDFSPDVPVGGGIWSVTLDADWTFPPSLLALVSAAEVTQVYMLAIWGKRVGIGGSASIVVGHDGMLTSSKSISIQDTVWKVYTIIDTISTESGDSVGVRLSGGVSPLAAGTTFFDLCLMERME